jgi:hypothetical protein
MGITPAQWRKMQEPSGQNLFLTSKAESAISPENSIE